MASFIRAAGLVLVAGLVVAGSASAQQVLVEIHDGRITLHAEKATLRQVLTEWARVGQTRIVNIERVPLLPVTVTMVNEPEGRALATLLRPLAGYMAAPRPTPVASASVFDRIVIMPGLASTAPPAASAAPSRSTPGSPFFQDPRSGGPMPGRGRMFGGLRDPNQSDTQGSDDDERFGGVDPSTGAAGAVVGVSPGMPQPGMLQQRPPQAPYSADPFQLEPPAGIQTQQPVNQAVPTAPGGAAIPGMVVPAPKPPGPSQPGPPKPPGERRNEGRTGR
jgi:hypothetical protein